MRRRPFWMAAWMVVLAACGGSSSQPLTVTRGKGSVTAELDGRGGALELRGVGRVTLPRGALEQRTELTVRTLAGDVLEQPARRYRPIGDPLVVTPHGLRLGRAALLEIAVTDDTVKGGDLRLLRLENEKDTTWQELGGVRVVKADEPASGDRDFELRDDGEDDVSSRRRVVAEVRGFSVFLPVALVDSGPCRGREEGYVCRPSAGPCDVAEVCDGTDAACPDDVLRTGDVCARGSGCLDDAMCTGESSACPARPPLAAGTACDDGQFCTDVDQCDGAGVCVGSGDPCAAGVGDGDANCSESCDEAADACTAGDPEGGFCRPTPCAEGRCQAGACATERECPIFVSTAGTDGSTCGTSWSLACATVQQGSDRAVAEARDWVFVGQGSYSSTVVTDPVLAMADGIAYYGGFGGTEDTLDQRPDPTTGESFSVLAGSGGSDHVVVGASNARLDGFRVTGGVLDQAMGTGQLGAGMFNDSVSDLVVANGAFESNTGYFPGGQGAGMYNAGVSNLSLSRVRFADNVVSGSGTIRGAGMASYDSTVTLDQVDFINNALTASGIASGGGLFEQDTQSEMTNVTFRDNTLGDLYSSQVHGAGYAMRATQSVATTLIDVTFSGNSANVSSGTAQGAGLYVETGGAIATLAIDRARFSGNSASGAFSDVQGAGLWASGTSLEMSLIDVGFEEHGLLAAAFGDARGGGLYAEDVVMSLTRVSFAGSSVSASSGTAYGGAMYFDGASIDMAGVQVVDNTAQGVSSASMGHGGGVYANSSALTLTDVDLLRNLATGFSGGFGGGLYLTGAGGSLQADNVGLVANISLFDGAGAYVNGIDTLEMRQATFAQNASGTASGEAMYLANASGGLKNVTMVGHAGTETTLSSANLATASEYVCSEVALGSNHTPVLSPSTEYVVNASGHAYLTATSQCIDAGDDGLGELVYGASGWQSLVTEESGALDTASVDTGRHYATDQLTIWTFQPVDPNTVSWQVQAPAGSRCTITSGGAFNHTIPAADLASGSVTHNLGSGPVLRLDCWLGGVLARAETSST